MGADFVYEIVDANMPLTHWQEILGELNDGQVEDFIKSPVIDYLFDDMTNQEIVERLDEAFQVVYGESREIGFWSPNGTDKYLLTGGMSWGDDPTDCYRDFELVGEFQRWHIR